MATGVPLHWLRAMARISSRTLWKYATIFTIIIIYNRWTLKCTPGEDCPGKREFIWGLVLLAFMYATILYLFITYRLRQMRMNTQCTQHTTAVGATPEKVYGLLRTKWLTHADHLQGLFDENPIIVKEIDYSKWQRMTELMNEVKYESIKCKELFPTKEYKASVLSDNTSDIPTIFADHVEMIESFAAKVNKLEDILKKKRENCGGCCV